MKSFWFALALVSATLSNAGAARGEEARLVARLTCDPALGPGRIRCELDLRAPEGARLSWADALVVSAPSFARPLRSRVPATREADGGARAALALLVRAVGSGSLLVLGRAVVCSTGEAKQPECGPASVSVEIPFRVGN